MVVHSRQFRRTLSCVPRFLLANPNRVDFLLGAVRSQVQVQCGDGRGRRVSRCRRRRTHRTRRERLLRLGLVAIFVMG